MSWINYRQCKWAVASGLIAASMAGAASGSAMAASNSAGPSAHAASSLKVYSSLSALVAAAKKEGTVNITVAPEFAPFMVPGFRKAYPWAKINATQLEPPEAAAQFSAQLKASANKADIIGLQVGNLQQFSSAGQLARIKVPNDSLVPAALRDKQGYAHAINQGNLALLYNTQLVKSPPKTLAALSSPQYKDKIVMLDPSLGGSSSAYLAAEQSVLGKAKWTTWMKGLAANDPQLSDSDSDSYATMLRGDRPICLCQYADYVAQKPGTPIGYQPYNQSSSGVLNVPVTLVVPSSAPDPAMAALFLNWMLSPKGGEKGMAASGRAPAVPVPGYSKISVPKGVKVAPLYNVLGGYLANTDSYINTYKSIFGS